MEWNSYHLPLIIQPFLWLDQSLRLHLLLVSQAHTRTHTHMHMHTYTDGQEHTHTHTHTQLSTKVDSPWGSYPHSFPMQQPLISQPFPLSPQSGQASFPGLAPGTQYTTQPQQLTDQMKMLNITGQLEQ